MSVSGSGPIVVEPRQRRVLSMPIVYPWQKNGDPVIPATRDSRTVLLTLGRLPVAIDIARSFSALGWRVIVADPFRMHLARMSKAVERCYRVTPPNTDAARFADDLLRIVRDEQVALVIPVSEESLYVAGIRDRLPGDVSLFCPSQDDMLSLHDKFRFVRLAESFGLSVPETCLVGHPGHADITRDGDYVSKPRLSCSGRNVRIHRAGDSPPTDRDLVLQRRIDGAHVSSFSVVVAGSVYSTSVYRGTVMDGSVAVCFEEVADADPVHDWVAAFAARSQHSGFLSFDFIIEDGVPCAIECNPRATSGIHFVASADLAPAILGDTRAVTHSPVRRRLTESYSCFTAVLKSLFSGDAFGTRLASLRAARDITWAPEDPWPFLLMMVNTWPIIARSMRHRETFAVAAVRDIEWLGPPGEAR